MDIKEFARNLTESENSSEEKSRMEYDREIASCIIEYIVNSGEVNFPELCAFQKTRARITAYDYNDVLDSLDLFYFIKADTVCGKVNNDKVKQGFNYLMQFYREAIDGTLFNNIDVDQSDEIVEVAQFVQSTKGNIKQIRVYVLTDGLTDPSAVPQPVNGDEIVIEFNVWDIQRVYQQHLLISGKEKVEIDFPISYNTELQCLKMSDQNPYVDAYLAIIPGIILAKIYKQYQQILLEKNVRTFLQFNNRVNKAIRSTLREQPDMFFSYNNGISTTASDIEIKEIDGMLYITNLYNWQIVNGGQTTAAISACINDREVDLSKVFVPMKISVIRDSDNSDEMVKAISTCANSQTAIKNSDFWANLPFFIDLENFSRQEWVPNGNNKPICKWYFERTRGQYLDQLAQLSGFNERIFKIEYPKNQKITKTDIAKYETLWMQKPYDVCKGAEKNFKQFVDNIEKEKPIASAVYYKRIIAKGILFDTIDSIVKSKKLGGYKSNMNAYIMAALSYLSKSNLNLSYIWENQRVQQEVVDKIEEMIPVVWMHLTQQTGTGNQSSNINEWSKKLDCWKRLIIKLSEIDPFNGNMIQPKTNEDGSNLNSAQLDKIKEAEAIEAKYWFALAKWTKAMNYLSPIDRKNAYFYGMLKSQNKGFKDLNQALKALDIVKRAKDLGFEG